MRLVAPAYRPTLADVLGPRLGRRGMRILAGLAVLAGAVVVAYGLRPADDGVEIVQRTGPAPFNLVSTETLRRVAPQGTEVLRLEGRRDGLFLQSFAVQPLTLARYRGDIAGALPLEAAREIEILRGRFDAFELVQDGKARVNDVPAYTILFRARLGRRRLFGREVILPQPAPGSRAGVRLLLLATPAGGVTKATDVGVRGAVKRPYRSFRFGTERP